MGIETRRKTIGENTFELTLLGTREGQRVLLRLGKLLGPAFIVIKLKGADGLGEAIQTALGSADGADLDFLIDTFAAKTDRILITDAKAGPGSIKVSMSDQYDSTFGRRYPEALAWMAWAIQENFASFFDAKGLAPLLALFPGLSRSESQKD
jgi:hypothetical protein